MAHFWQMRSSANFLLQYVDMDAISPLHFHRIYNFIHAGVAELADALDLGSSGHPRAGSSPVTRTPQKSNQLIAFFIPEIHFSPQPGTPPVGPPSSPS